MKKITISKLFLYKHRFVIGYTILAIAFIILIFGLPLISQSGLSQAEMDSAVSSYYLSPDAISSGDLVDLPFRLLQKLSITIFGLSAYSIKLPSIIIGLFLALVLIMLLNRWFKNNVSLLASGLVILSTPFLYLAGSGTPLIMLIFWPTLLLWLGSKIQGEKKPSPTYSFLFAIALLLSIFTPYMVYFALFCVIFVIAQPHLRFIVKSLPKVPFIIISLLVVGGIGTLVANIIMHPDTIMELLFAKSYNINDFFSNIAQGLTFAFQFKGSVESTFVSPLISLPTLAIALIGLFSTTRGFFASRNSIATLLIIYTLIITGFNPEAIIFLILPIAILDAHGIKYLLEKWYGLFPENPYARVAAFFPLAILFGMIIIPSLVQYINTYRYNPAVAQSFTSDLRIIRENLTSEVLVVSDNYDFYHILNDTTDLTVVSEAVNLDNADIAVLHGGVEVPENYKLNKIITSPEASESDIIYLYTLEGE